jgi:hypothetical protein
MVFEILCLFIPNDKAQKWKFDMLYNASVYKDDKAMLLGFCSSERCYITKTGIAVCP